MKTGKGYGIRLYQVEAEGLSPFYILDTDNQNREFEPEIKAHVKPVFISEKALDRLAENYLRRKEQQAFLTYYSNQSP